MKRTIILCTFSQVVFYVMGQQTPQFSQYLFNNYAINPAVAGSAPCLDIRMGYRSQWVGFDGAPRTYFASINKAVGKKDEKLNGGWHGFGLYVENDVTGPYNAKGFYPSYAYNKKVSGRYVVAMGFFVGFRQHSFKGSATFGNSGDPALANQQVVTIIPDISPGLWFYSKTTYVGLSVKQIYKTTLKDQASQIGSPSSLKPHFYFMVGNKRETKAQITYHPSLHIKYTMLYPPAIDINFLMIFRKRLGLGISYRNTDALVGIMQLRISRTIKIGYAFDYTTSVIRHSSSNSHEIIIGLTPCPRTGDRQAVDECPSY